MIVTSRGLDINSPILTGGANAVFFSDAFKPSKDPTGTLPIRKAFGADALMRLRKVRAHMRVALVDQDTLGLAHGAMGYHPGEVRLYAFEQWLSTAFMALTTGYWWQRYVDAAWGRGTVQALAEVRVPGAPNKPPATLAWLAEQELNGIVAAVVQQTARVAERAMVRRTKPRVVWQQVAKVLDKVGEERIRQLVDYAVVAAYNRAKIATYRGAGIKHIGVVPELRQVKRVRHVHDADVGELVGIRTAGDDRVCVACEDFADDAPYELDEVEDALPLHIRCRCSWFPWDDKRFKHDTWSEAAREAALEARRRGAAQLEHLKHIEVKKSISDFVTGPGKAAIGAAVTKLSDNKKELLAGAVVFSLYHLVGLDFPVEVEQAIHEQVVHFAENAHVAVSEAREHMRKAVDSLIELRKKPVTDAATDEVLVALIRLKRILDNDKLFEKDGVK